MLPAFMHYFESSAFEELHSILNSFLLKKQIMVIRLVQK